MKKALFLLLIVATPLLLNSCSDDNAVDYTLKRNEVVNLVDSAVSLFQDEQSSGTTDFTNFWSGLKNANDLNIAAGIEYVFVFNINDGGFFVHPTLTLGSDIRDVASQDTPPIPAGQMIFDSAIQNPIGSWVEYSYTDLSTNRITLKHTYIVVSGDYGFASGYNEN